MMPTVAFATVGCRLNQVDTDEMQARLEARGFRTVDFDDPADVVVVNSCTVTGRADFSDRQMIRRATRRNPSARVVVTGCWAQTDPARVAATGVDLVVGNTDKARIAELIEELMAEGDRRPARIEVGDVAAARSIEPAPPGQVTRRSRAFLKVQEGCQHRCAFCIVPLARGASRSQSPEILLAQVRRLVDAGHAEVVLTGVDLGHYGADLRPRTSLAALIETMAGVPGLRWIHLSSVLPAYFTPELLDVVTRSPLVAPHLHIPLQSGSDRVLRRMRRPYTARMYRAVIERLAAAIPRLGLGADVIVGFPGESEADFEATRQLIEDLPFSYLHVFVYSDRKGTEAATLDGRVDSRTAAQRSEALRALARVKRVAFTEAMVGMTQDALVLETRDRATGGLVALTGNYVEVVLDGTDALMRTMIPVRITRVEAGRAFGVLA